MAANKFVFDWQLVRVEAKKIKNVNMKLSHVLDFLSDHPSRNNYERVLNWVKTTRMAYPPEAKGPFDDALTFINAQHYQDIPDEPDNLHTRSTKDLNAVMDDLGKRKYNFQFNKTPKAHVTFVDQLQAELENRQHR